MKEKNSSFGQELLAVSKIPSLLLFKSSSILQTRWGERQVDKDSVVHAYNQRMWTDSDLFMVYAVAMLGYATPDAVHGLLAQMRRRYPELLIPETDLGGVKNRLSACATCGLVKGLEYLTSDETDAKKTVIIVYATRNGVEAVRRKLLMGVDSNFLSPEKQQTEVVYFREYLGIDNVTTVLAVAAASYVTQHVMRYGYHLSKIPILYHTKDYTFYKQRVAPILTHPIRVVNQQEERSMILVEPIFFSYDDNLTPKEQIDALRIKRIQELSVWYRMMKDEGKKVLLIWVCETIQGIVQLARLVAKYGNTAVSEEGYYTTDQLIRFIEKQNLDEGTPFIRFKTDKGEVKMYMEYLSLLK